MRCYWIVAVALVVAVGCGKGSAPAGRTTAGLGYTLTPPEGFALAADNGKTKNWTPAGRTVAPDEPRIVLTRSSKVLPPDDEVRRLVPEQMIKGLTGSLAQPVIVKTTPVTIDGMPGFEVTAKAVAVGNGAPVRVYVASVFAADGTFHVVAYDGGEDSLSNLDLFRAAAHTLTVK